MTVQLINSKNSHIYNVIITRSKMNDEIIRIREISISLSRQIVSLEKCLNQQLLDSFVILNVSWYDDREEERNKRRGKARASMCGAKNCLLTIRLKKYGWHKYTNSTQFNRCSFGIHNWMWYKEPNVCPAKT